jgi:hypothetical protein
MNYIETLIKAQKELEQIAVKGGDVFHMGNALVAISGVIEQMAKEANHEAVAESDSDKDD